MCVCADVLKLVVQTGDPNPNDDSNPVHGYAVNGKERTVPLEVMALEDNKPTYGVSSFEHALSAIRTHVAMTATTRRFGSASGSQTKEHHKGVSCV